MLIFLFLLKLNGNCFLWRKVMTLIRVFTSFFVMQKKAMARVGNCRCAKENRGYNKRAAAAEVRVVLQLPCIWHPHVAFKTIRDHNFTLFAFRHRAPSLTLSLQTNINDVRKEVQHVSYKRCKTQKNPKNYEMKQILNYLKKKRKKSSF